MILVLDFEGKVVIEVKGAARRRLAMRYLAHGTGTLPSPIIIDFDFAMSLPPLICSHEPPVSQSQEQPSLSM